MPVKLIAICAAITLTLSGCSKSPSPSAPSSVSESTTEPTDAAAKTDTTEQNGPKIWLDEEAAEVVKAVDPRQPTDVRVYRWAGGHIRGWFRLDNEKGRPVLQTFDTEKDIRPEETIVSGWLAVVYMDVAKDARELKDHEKVLQVSAYYHIVSKPKIMTRETEHIASISMNRRIPGGLVRRDPIVSGYRFMRMGNEFFVRRHGETPIMSLSLADGSPYAASYAVPTEKDFEAFAGESPDKSFPFWWLEQRKRQQTTETPR